jgi:hypothetical protein
VFVSQTHFLGDTLFLDGVITSKGVSSLVTYALQLQCSDWEQALQVDGLQAFIAKPWRICREKMGFLLLLVMGIWV